MQRQIKDKYLKESQKNSREIKISHILKQAHLQVQESMKYLRLLRVHMRISRKEGSDDNDRIESIIKNTTDKDI